MVRLHAILLSGRGGNISMIVGSSLSDFALKSMSKNLTHRSRTSSRNSVPFSPIMTCSFLDFSLPTLPYSSGAYRTLAGRCPIVVSRFRRGALKISMYSCGDHLLQIRTRVTKVSCTRFYPGGARARVVTHPASRSMLF